ncbi:MAG: MarR family winged helix-turn-helix transcriptional regulator [Pseudonocardiaceae bacterium]
MGDGGWTQARSNGRHATGGQLTDPVMAQDIDWLMTHLRDVVAASPPAVWAGRGMTLPQLTTMHLISALEPVSLADLARALGTRPPATSAMVDRLAHAGMVCRTQDPANRRRIQLTLTDAAKQIIGDTGPDTARRLHAVLAGMSAQARSHLIDVLRDSVQRSAV